MHGDFSRGHRPDRKRGKAYRRVLLQQGRTLLDSDFNALSDANEHLLRELARDVGLGDGSPDGGFRITVGPLLARFDTLQDVVPDGTDFVARLDLRHRYEERLPSLLLDARRGAGKVTLRLRRRLLASECPKLRIWARLPGALRVGIGGGAEQPFPGNLSAERFQAYELPVPAGVTDFDSLTLRFETVGPDNEAWIGLIEGIPADTKAGPFWVSRGRYRVDGLAVELREDAPYPEVSFPRAKGFRPRLLDVGVHVAYLELWERHVTHVEDPGLLEPALGGTVDTCTRVETVGQVKLAKFDKDENVELAGPESFRTAFTWPNEPARTLRVQPRRVALDPGTVGSALYTGYTGAENRLYRFEIHDAGALGVATLKWSRNNGASLFRVLRVMDANTTLALPTTSDVRNGDLIEVLTETVELGDGNDGQVVQDTAAVRFSPPTRTVGRLYYVREKGLTGSERLIELRDVTTRLPVPLDTAIAGQPGMKIRRWDGFLQTNKAGTTLEIEDGLDVGLTGGPFRAGDYWQYEARRGQEGTTTPWEPPVNGSERLFVPLALVRLRTSGGPVQIDAWLDPDPSSGKKLWADNVLYDGTPVPTSAGTVQEALDELYARYEGEHCDARLSPGLHGADDGERLSLLIQQKLPTGGVVCLSEGLFRLKSRVEILGKHVELRGQPGTFLVGEVPVAKTPNDSALHVGQGGRLTLSGLTVVAGVNATLGRGELVSFTADCAGFSARDCMFFHLREDAAGIALRSAAPVLPAKEPADRRGASSATPVSGAPEVRLDGCTLVAGWGLSAGNLEGLVLRDTTVLGVGGGLFTKELGELELQGASIDTGLVAVTLQEWARRPVAQLAAAVTAWREANTVTTGQANSTALYAARVGGGFVRESTFVAGMGLWFGAATNLRLERNHYFVGDTAVRVDHATDTVLDTETVATGNLGLHVPFVALGVSLSGCRLQGPRAVVLGGEYLAAPTAQQRAAYPLPPVRLRDLRVRECFIEASRVALHLGPREADTALPAGMEFWNLELRENTLRATTAEAVAVSGVLPGQGSDFVLRLSDNQLETRQTAVRLKGRGFELSRNRLRAEGRDTLVETPPSGVIALVQSDQGLIQGNIVQLVNLGAGICVQGSRDVRVSGNTVSCPTGARPLWVLESQRVEVRENELQAGRSLVVGADVLSVQGNRVAGALVIRDSRQGVVTLNRIDLDEAFPLSIEQARENWRITENTAVGGIRILPAVEGVTPPATEKEREFHVQMEGNWARDLQVGYLNPADAARPSVADLALALPHASSLVQLVGNRAQARLVANHYWRSLITNNVIGALICAAAGTSRIHKHNLGITTDIDTGDTTTPGGGGTTPGGGGTTPGGGTGPTPSVNAGGGAWNTSTVLPSGKVLVVGGTAAGGVCLDTAFLFNPATDTWTPAGRMSSPRSQHTATLLDSGKVLIAGGWNGTQALASVEQYDPATGTWSPLEPMTAARSQASATLLPGGKVLVAGGTSGTTPLASVELYDVATNKWATSSLASARSQHVAVRLQGGQVLVAGGQGVNGPLPTAELYDPASTSQNKWSTVGGMTMPRARATGMLLGSGEVLVAGGADDSGALSTADVYNPTTRSWSSSGLLNAARHSHTTTLLGSGKVLVVGGEGRQGTQRSAEVYEPATGNWSLVPEMLEARQGHSITQLSTGALLVVGGTRGSTVLSSVELYLPVEPHWSFVSPASAYRTDFTATVLPSGKVLVAGGRTGNAYHASAELYDPATRTWTPTGRMTQARYGHTATLLDSGKVLVIGGATGGTNQTPVALKSLELYDPSTGQWSPAGDMAEACFFHAVIKLESGEVLVIGGTNGQNALATVKLWSTPGNWAALRGLNQARHGHSAVQLGNTFIVQGGTSGSTVLDSRESIDYASLITYRFNYEWSLRTTEARAFHTVTRLPTGRLLVAGGTNGSTPLDSAVLDAENLYATPLAPAGKMSTARSHHTAALLPTGEVLVMGGKSTHGTETATTEFYHPGTNSWSAGPTMASARKGHAMAVLPEGELFVFGGEAAGQALSATERYGTGRSAWRPTWPMAAARKNHSAILLDSGEVLVVGNSCELYDPRSRSWRATDSFFVNNGFSGHAVLLPRVGNAPARVLAVTLVDSNELMKARLYDPVAGTWTETSDMHYRGRVAFTLTLFTAGPLVGQVLMVGIETSVSYGGDEMGASELFNPATGTWSQAAQMLQDRRGHTATALGTGAVLVTGGSDSTWVYNQSGTDILSSAELFDPTAKTWSNTGSLKQARTEHTATLLPSGKVLVVGGLVSFYNSTATATAELYDPNSGTWSTTGSMSQARHGHAAVLLSSGKVLVSGGVSGSTRLSSVELYDPGTGTWMQLEPMTVARDSHTATQLTSGVVLVAGGVASGAVILAETYGEAVSQPAWRAGPALPTGS